jgi:hypothetical protein
MESESKALVPVRQVVQLSDAQLMSMEVKEKPNRLIPYSRKTMVEPPSQVLGDYVPPWERKQEEERPRFKIVPRTGVLVKKGARHYKNDHPGLSGIYRESVKQHSAAQRECWHEFDEQGLCHNCGAEYQREDLTKKIPGVYSRARLDKLKGHMFSQESGQRPGDIDGHQRLPALRGEEPKRVWRDAGAKPKSIYDR